MLISCPVGVREWQHKQRDVVCMSRCVGVLEATLQVDQQSGRAYFSRTGTLTFSRDFVVTRKRKKFVQRF